MRLEMDTVCSETKNVIFSSGVKSVNQGAGIELPSSAPCAEEVGKHFWNLLAGKRCM